MTYDEWVVSGKLILKQADAYNAWARDARFNLLTVIGPNLARYNGGGFGYDKLIKFGRLIETLAISWQPSVETCDKVEDQFAANMITKILYEELVEWNQYILNKLS